MPKLTKRQAESLQWAVERVETLRLEVARRDGISPDARDDLKMKLDWITREIRNIALGADKHTSSAGLSCGCHEFPTKPTPDCPRCSGVGIVKRAVIVQRAEEYQ